MVSQVQGEAGRARPTRVVLWILGVVAAAAFAHFLRNEQRERHASEELLRKELRAMSQELKQVRSGGEHEWMLPFRLAHANSPRSEAAPPPAPPSSPTPELDTSERNDPALSPNEALEARVAEVVESTELRLKGEAPDPAWSGQATQQIRDVVAGLQGTRLLTTDCRASLCRVEVEHDSAQVQSNLSEQIGQSAPFASGCLYRRNAAKSGGYPVTTLYVTREGSHLGKSEPPG